MAGIWKTARHLSTILREAAGDCQGWVITSGDGRHSLSDIRYCAVTGIVKNIPTRKRRKLMLQSGTYTASARISLCAWCAGCV